MKTMKEKIYKALQDLANGRKDTDHTYHLLDHYRAKEEIGWVIIFGFTVALAVAVGILIGYNAPR
jgi:hypothetical protein